MFEDSSSSEEDTATPASPVSVSGVQMKKNDGNSQKRTSEDNEEEEDRGLFDDTPLTDTGTSTSNINDQISCSAAVHLAALLDNNDDEETITRKRSSNTPSTGASRSSNSNNEHVVCHKRPKIGGDNSSDHSKVALDGCHQQQDTTTTTTTNTNNNNSNKVTTPMPTTTDVSLALCAIDYYGTRDKVTWDEVMQALEDLCNWRKNCNFDDADSVNTSKLTDVFIERCAGVPRILDFITKNRNDIKLLFSSVKVLQSFLCYGKIGEHLLSTIEVAKKVVKYDGIKLLISITLDMFIGELNHRQLRALNNIWPVFGTLIHDINQNNMVDMDKVIPIIDCGISTLDVINKISDAEDVVVKIKSSVILSFCRIMDNAEMIDEEDFHRKNIFHTCVQAMKNSNNDDNDERSWKHNADTRGKTTHFFTNAAYIIEHCCQKKLIIK